MCCPGAWILTGAPSASLTTKQRISCIKCRKATKRCKNFRTAQETAVICFMPKCSAVMEHLIQCRFASGNKMLEASQGCLREVKHQIRVKVQSVPFDWFANAKQTFYFIIEPSTCFASHPCSHSLWYDPPELEKPAFYPFFYCIFLPILRKLCTWLCCKCISWFWAELWLASQQISVPGFYNWTCSECSFSVFQKTSQLNVIL